MTIWSNGYSEDFDLQHTNNQGVYDKFGREIVGKVRNGEDCCVITYGACGSGKTYTLFGKGQETGVAEIMAGELMATVGSLTISMYEQHENAIKDLLSGQDGLKYRVTPTNVVIEHLTNQPLTSPSDITACIESGHRNWMGSSTHRMNAYSKPTHVFIELRAALSDGRNAKLLICDLAGEEHPASCCTPSKETIAVNQSIRVFKDVITKLSSQKPGKSSVIPFRESLLTLLLRPSLTGSQFTTLLATISPSISSLPETLDTLQLCTQVLSANS